MIKTDKIFITLFHENYNFQILLLIFCIYKNLNDKKGKYKILYLILSRVISCRKIFTPNLIGNKR